MSSAELIPLVIKVSIVLTVFALGLKSSPQDAAHLVKRPGQLVRSMLSMNVVMPEVSGDTADITVIRLSSGCGDRGCVRCRCRRCRPSFRGRS